MTQNIPTDKLGRVYAEWAVEMEKDPNISTELLRIIFDDWQRVTSEPEDVTYKETEIGGVPGIFVSPTDANTDDVMVLVHGGGFALGSSRSHRKMAGHLAKATKSTAFVPDFRLAPEHKFPAAIEDGVAIILALLEQGYKAENIILAGDSAGGNIAISTTLKLQEMGKDLPAQVVTISPWLDMENSGKTIETNDATDFLITREGLQGNIDRYIEGATAPTDPLANPLYADFKGFPRLYISVADTESLYHDSIRLHKIAKAAGVDVTLSVAEGMQHVFPMMAGNHKRADEEIARIAAWCREA